MFFQVAQKGSNNFFKYLLTIIAVFIAALLGNAPLLFVLAGRSAGDPQVLQELRTEDGLDFSAVGLDPNFSLFLILLSFIFAMIALLVFVRWVHGKPLLSVVTSRRRLDWARVFFAFGIWFGLSLLHEGISYAIEPDNYSLQFQWSSFIPLLAIALFILPVQTSFEEIMFRGYLMQGIGLWSGNRWFPLLITSIIFGLLHFSNPEVTKFGAGLMMSYYIGIGFFLGVCTLMDDGLEFALGIHAATNIYGATIVSFSGAALQTPAIFRIQHLDTGLMLIAGLASAILFLIIAARKYGWADWRKLYGPLDVKGKPSVLDED